MFFTQSIILCYYIVALVTPIFRLERQEGRLIKCLCNDSLFTPSTRWSSGVTGPLQHSATSNITRFQGKNKFKIFVLRDTDFQYSEYHNTFLVMISRDVCPVFMSVNNVLTASSTSLNFFSATLRIRNSSQLQC